MAGADREAADSLAEYWLERLRREPHRFDLFAAIRLLECLRPDKPRVGHSRRPHDDTVRFGQAPNTTFAPATLAAFRPRDRAQGAHYLISNHPGLLGPNGALPLHLTEYARDRLRNFGDPTAVRFLDLFHHRLVSLFYRAWADAQPASSYDRPDRDRFGEYLGSLFGIGESTLRGRDALPDLAKLHFTGRLSAQCRNAEGLEAMIQVFFAVPVRVEPFVGRWLNLPAAARSRLGESRETGKLGVNMVLGARVWECQSRFRIVLGALALVEFERLLPGGESLERLQALVLNYVGYELDWDLNLVLRREEAPPLELGRAGRLGWTTWLGADGSGPDLDNLILEPMAMGTRNRTRETHGN